MVGRRRLWRELVLLIPMAQNRVLEKIALVLNQHAAERPVLGKQVEQRLQQLERDLDLLRPSATSPGRSDRTSAAAPNDSCVLWV